MFFVIQEAKRVGFEINLGLEGRKRGKKKDKSGKK
jgi:hypothetical protein